MKSILVVSNLFPNNNQPSRGIFIKERLLQLRTHIGIRVISPVPWSIPWSAKRWRMQNTMLRRDLVDGFEVWYPRYFTIPKVGRLLDGFFFYLSLRAFLRRFVARHPVDAILTHWAFPDAFGMTLINYSLNRPMFIQVHGNDVNRAGKSYLRGRMTRFALKRAKKVFSPAYRLREAIVALGIGEDRVCTIPNGVDHSAFSPRDRKAARARLGLPSEKKIVLFVGNLVDVKGLPYLIEAAALLLKDRNDLLFLIIGEGKRKATLQQMIARLRLEADVRLVGRKPHEEIPCWMSSCDLVCLPSLSEGCPNVVVEALASGRPVVGSDVGDIPRLLKMSGGGCTVRPADSEALAQGIEKTLAQVWDPDVLSRSVRELTWENAARQVWAQISAALPGKSP